MVNSPIHFMASMRIDRVNKLRIRGDACHIKLSNFRGKARATAGELSVGSGEARLIEAAYSCWQSPERSRDEFHLELDRDAAIESISNLLRNRVSAASRLRSYVNAGHAAICRAHR